MDNRNNRNANWADGISALSAAAGDESLTKEERDAIAAASAVLAKKQACASDEAMAAYEEAMAGLKWPAPEGAHVIWSDMSPMADPAWDRAIENHPDADVSLMETMADEHASQWQDDEKANLAGKGRFDLLCVCDLGSWRGRRDTARIIEQTTLPDALFRACMHHDHNEYTVYGLGGQIRVDASHHDATDHFILYEITDLDELRRVLNMPMPVGLEKRVEQAASQCVKSLYPAVAAVYGWPVEQNDDNDAKGGGSNG